MTDFNQKIMDITLLGVTPKTLDDDGMAFLKSKILEYQQKNNTVDVIDCLPFIVTFIFNHAYARAVEDVLTILRRR